MPDGSDTGRTCMSAPGRSPALVLTRVVVSARDSGLRLTDC